MSWRDRAEKITSVTRNRPAAFVERLEWEEAQGRIMA